MAIASRPLFVFGIARSGTNLIAGLLNAHGAVTLVLDPLMPYFKALRDALVADSTNGELRRRYPPGCPLQDYYFAPQGRALLDLVMAGSLDVPLSDEGMAERIAARAALESPQMAGHLGAIAGETYRELLDDVLKKLDQLGDGNTQWCGSKEVWTTEFIPALARTYPDAKFVVIRRDPRAIIASLVAMAKQDPSQAAHTVSYMRHWRKEAAVLDELLRAPGLANRILVMRYEELTQRTAEQTAILAKFLEIDVEPFTSSAAASRQIAGNSSYGEMRGVSRESVARWRTTLSPALARTIEFHCGPEMLTEGYPLSAAWPVALDVEVRQEVRDAASSAGSWRSDSGDPEADLACELQRWERLAKRGAAPPETHSIRRDFLFEPFFARICSVVWGSS